MHDDTIETSDQDNNPKSSGLKSNVYELNTWEMKRKNSIISILEDALELARAGMLTQIAICYGDKEGGGSERISICENAMHLLGCATMLQAHIVKVVTGESTLVYKDEEPT